ncbi:hypothetical protein [Thalassobius sp. Cn5-15]|nr:hypothetical protein [Thalassobius sp. Cn5-15]
MIRDIKAAIVRSSDTLLADTIGAAALVAMFVIGLHLPLLT